MVYCGKPSLGCQMCKTRRIKVRAITFVTHPRSQTSLLLPSVLSSHPSLAILTNNPSVTKADPPAPNAPNPDANVLATKTTSTSSSATRHSPPKNAQKSPVQKPNALPPPPPPNLSSHHNDDRTKLQRNEISTSNTKPTLCPKTR